MRTCLACGGRARHGKLALYDWVCEDCGFHWDVSEVMSWGEAFSRYVWKGAGERGQMMVPSGCMAVWPALWIAKARME